jgi:iron complex transport system permease protein
MAAVKTVTSRRLLLLTGLSAAVMLATALLTPLVGSSHVDYSRALAGLSPDREILFFARIPRVLLSLLAGGGLAVAGVLFQALLRDALATPFTLGVSSGASLGAVLAICLGWTNLGPFPATWASAFIGSGVVLMMVLAIASEKRRMSSFTLLLSGTTINSISMAGIMFLQYLSTFGQSFAIVRWLMGGIESVDYGTLGWLAAIVLPVTGVLFWRSRDWNLLAVGEDWAAARGVSTSRILIVGYLAGSFLTASITALTGPIGFIGLIVPHALRMRLGADHRVLIPCSFFIGAAFLAICDTLSRTILSPIEIPVGVTTAILGGPVFIYLLRVRGRIT